MKKKIICLILSVSIIASMTAIVSATNYDNPRACSPVLLIKEVTTK